MLYKSKNILTLVTIGYIVGFIVGIYIEYCLLGPSGRFTHVVIILNCLGHVSSRFCIRVELPIQRRLCPIFVRNVGSPDIHEYSVG